MPPRPIEVGGAIVEPYRPGKQNTPLLLLTFAVLVCSYIVTAATAHVKQHQVNKRFPFDFSPVLDDHFWYGAEIFEDAASRFHPLLLREYALLLIGRFVYAMLYAAWGYEILLRAIVRVWESDPESVGARINAKLPIQSLPFVAAICEIVENCVLLYLLHIHPDLFDGAANFAGILALTRHSASAVCWTLGTIGAVAQMCGCARATPSRHFR
jgi:hypothetical protein